MEENDRKRWKKMTGKGGRKLQDKVDENYCKKWTKTAVKDGRILQSKKEKIDW